MEQGLQDIRLIGVVSIAFLWYLSVPEISARLWHFLKKKSGDARKMRMLRKERRAVAGRMKKYWEIDMRNFR